MKGLPPSAANGAVEHADAVVAAALVLKKPNRLVIAPGRSGLPIFYGGQRVHG